MELTSNLKEFIEDHINLIEKGDISLVLYQGLFKLTVNESELLANIFKDLLNINIESFLLEALIEWSKDNVALKHRAQILVAQLLQNTPRFGYNFSDFRNIAVRAITTAYPNKILRPDRYGMEYIVEKQ